MLNCLGLSKIPLDSRFRLGMQQQRKPQPTTTIAMAINKKESTCEIHIDIQSHTHVRTVQEILATVANGQVICGNLLNLMQIG